MLGKGLLVGAAVTAMLVTSAAAQEPGPELERTYFRTAAGPRSLARYADCLIHRHPQEARALFDNDYGSAEFAQAQSALFEDSRTCLFSNRSLSWSGVMMMGTLAEILIDKDKPARPVGRVLRSEFVGGGTFAWQWQGLSAEHERRMVALAECLLTRHGDKAAAVLDERPNAEGERGAYNAMRTEIADCIPSGERRVLNPQQLRAAMAATFYRAARAAAQPSGAAG